MASSKEDEHFAEEVSGRRTRSGRKVSATESVVSPVRATRRTTRKSVQEQLTEHEAADIVNEEQLPMVDEDQQSDVIKEMLAAAAQGVIIEDDNVVHYEDHTEVKSNEEVPQTEDHIVFEEQIVQDAAQTEDHQIIYEEQVVENVVVEQIEDELFAMQEEQNNSDIPVTSETGIDEKSSSFPFGTVGQSETSQSDVQNEEEEEATGRSINETGAVESFLLASLAGDNANSLPSVGGSEEADKKQDFVTEIVEQIQPNCEKMESDDSLSEPAIAEDHPNAADASDATIVNTEIISEDELPLPTKPEINDAEEVSDDELPAPQRAELPADAEVISEDELPSTTTTEKTASSVKEKATKKRRHDDVHKQDETAMKKAKSEESADETRKSSAEQYNPMSPTSESNEATTPTEKTVKMDVAENESKEKKKDKDKDKDKEKEKEKEKDKEKEKEKDKERKKLPDLEKYWRAVKEDPADFTGWTYLLQYVDNETDAEAAREAYDAFLSQYPYCYGYWRKYADYEKRKGIKANCNTVFERGLEAIPLSVDLWIHYLTHVKATHPDDEEYIRTQFQRAVDACGLEFRSDKLWDAFIKWERDGGRYQRVMQIYDRLLAIPTQGYSGHFDNFQDLVNQHSITSLISNEELKKIRLELRQSASSRSSSHGKSHRRSSSKDKERSDQKDHRDDAASKSPVHKNADGNEEVTSTDAAEIEQDTEKMEVDLSDPSTLTDEEMSSIKDKVISIRRKLHKLTVAAVTVRWTFEEAIKRPYFHVKPLERCQLKNWKDYLDFEIEKGDHQRILVLFERCLIACALYDEFWLKMLRYLETQLDQPGTPAIMRDVFRRACQIHHPDKPSLHLMWAAFEECQNEPDSAANVLTNFDNRCPNLLQVIYRRINVERRRGDYPKCSELYEHYIATAKNKTIAGTLAIKYARFLNKICHDLDRGMQVLRQALEKDVANARVALQMIDLALQRDKVDENEVVLIMDKFMARENIDPEQKVLFAQRKVEFLEDFGSSARGLQDAQRSLQVALTKAKEVKKKRESSPSRKSTAGIKDAPPMSGSSNQPMYNNGVAPVGTGYNYNTANSAYYNQQNSGAYQHGYDGYYNQWQYGTGYSGYGQWSGYGNYY